MKYFATLVLATALAGGFATMVQSAPYNAYEADVLEALPGASDATLDHPYHHCHGRTSGTAHASCGTATGGPSGSLF